MPPALSVLSRWRIPNVTEGVPVVSIGVLGEGLQVSKSQPASVSSGGQVHRTEVCPWPLARSEDANGEFARPWSGRPLDLGGALIRFDTPSDRPVYPVADFHPSLASAGLRAGNEVLAMMHVAA